MPELKIKEQTLPTRCEICHQSDQFDAVQSYCSRCADIKILAPTDAEDNQITIQIPRPYNLKVMVKWVVLVHICLTIVITFLFNQALDMSIAIAIVIAILFPYFVPHRVIAPESANIDAIYLPLNQNIVFPINNQLLRQHTIELEAMGFINYGDFQVRVSNWYDRFARIFHNPEKGCFVELSQYLYLLSEDPNIPMMIFIVSFFEQDKQLRTFNYELNPFVYKYALPIMFSFPDLNLKEQIDKHIELQKRLTQANEQVQSDITLTFYLERISEIYRNLAYHHSYAIPIIRRFYSYWFRLNPKQQSTGKYHKIFR